MLRKLNYSMLSTKRQIFYKTELLSVQLKPGYSVEMTPKGQVDSQG